MFRRAFRTAIPLLACLTLLVGMPAAGAQTSTPSPVQISVGTPEEKAAKIVAPAVVYLEQYWKAWVRVPRASGLFFDGYVNDGYAFEWATRCSGFIVSPDGYVVTAGHCVDSGEEGARDTALALAVQWLIDNGWAYQRDFNYWLDEAHLSWGVEGSEKGSDPDLEVWVQRGVAAGGLKAGEAFPARVVTYSPWSEGDGALLKIEQGDLPVVLVAPSSDISIGTPVLSVGYPGSTDAVTDTSYEPTFKDGQINAEKTREGGLLPVYEMSAALSGGMSGGPTVNLEGAVVGVNSFGIVGETEAFNFITPSSIVSEMMAQNGVANALGPIDENYRAGLDAYYAGDYATAVTEFDEVLAVSPTHDQAQEMKIEATKLLQAQPSAPPTAPPTGAQGGQDGQGKVADEGGFPVVVVVIIAIAVLGGIAAFVLFTRRKKGPGAPAQVQPLQAVGAPAPGAEAARSVGFQPSPPAAAPNAAAPSPPPPAGQAPPAAAPTSPQAGQEGQTQEYPNFCPSCGHKLEPDAHFCPSCGHKIGG